MVDTQDIQDRPITLTEAAAKHIQSELNKSDDCIQGLKLGVKTTGCSGYAYVLDFIKSTDNTEDYKQFESKGIKIFVDNKSYSYIAGTEVDYVQQGIGKVMVFNNPQATAECGCGESFTIDEDKA